MARRDEKKRRKRDDLDSEDSDERIRRSRKSRKSRKDSDDDDSNEDASTSDSDGDRGRNRKRRSRGSRKKKQRGGDSSESDDSSQKSKRDSRRRRRERSDSEGSESSGGSSGSDSSEGSPSRGGRGGKKVSEEELREYLAKRAQKKAQKLAKKLKPNAVSGYTNDSNPFGDTNLTETFVWRKKIEKDVLRGTLDPREITLQNERKRLEARMEEIEKVKKRREERMLEKAQHDEEMAMLARERARAEFQDWEEKEDEFHFEQSRVRSEIRLREGRAKPIDVLARNLTLSGDFDIEVNEPYKIFKGLTVKEMEELKEDIKMHLEFDRNNPMHQEFWKAMMVVCNHEIAETTRRDIIDRARVRGEEPPADVLEEERGLHSAVGADVAETLAVAGSEELSRMEERIAGQMETGSAKVVEYWEAVLKKLKIFKAKARLREIHADLLRQHLALLETGGVARGEGGVEEREGGEGRGGGRGGEGRGWEEEEEEMGAVSGTAAGGGAGGGGGGGGEEGEPGSFSPELLTMEEAAKEGYKEGGEGAAGAGGGGAEGGFSPELIHTYEVDGTDVVDPEADKQELERKRAQIQADRQRSVLEASGAGGGDVSAAERALVVRAPADVAAAGDGQLSAAEKAAANKMMGQDPGDVAFGAGAEVPLETQVYWWHDKYRPRKPKYFNRVHTGYEWNKYNQTHYDHDNPPPKIVQGYKFNIFYPDLIDRSKPPSYHIEKDGSADGETCLIRFHAGPPYEDIAFRIVNKEWEYSHKKGFKCTFERGILHVYINFKRHRYRR
ncbi:unnamed protein product [Closterium sp. Yama58-4]|nr:unnamed protein product [Closterium sp. Yama58-4]